MKLAFWNRGGSESKPVIPEMNGPMPQSSGSNLMRWVRVAVLVIVALFILWLLYLAGLWIAHKVTGNDSSTTSHSGNSSNGGAPVTQAPNDSSAPSGSDGSGSGQSPATAGNTGTQPGSTAANNGTLANTGPGSEAALFFIVTATGVVAYQVVLRRRAE